MRLWAKPIPRPFRFHDLRHTAATLMILAGGKPHEVQRILRHKSLDKTMRIYAHLFAEDLRPVVNLLPAVRRRARRARAPVSHSCRTPHYRWK
jgi:integrase